MQQGFTFCICPDGMLLQQYLEERITTQYHTSNWSKSIYWGDEELPKKFWDDLTLQNLFTTEHILIIRNAHNISSEIWKNLSSILNTPTPHIWTIFCLEGAWEKKQPKIPSSIQKLSCFAFAKKNQWIWSSPGLDKHNLKAFITAQARNLNLTFEPVALDTLTDILPPNAAIVNSELSKLLLHKTADTAITTQDISIVTCTTTFDIFMFLQQVQINNVSQIWKILIDEQRKGEDPLFYIIAMLQREAKMLWKLLMGEQTKNYPNQHIKKQLAKHIGITGITKIWDILHTAEYSVKSGNLSPSQALESLISGLLPIFA